MRLHGEQLMTEIRVLNTDTKAFDFTAALHSYFEVKHVSEARVTGLKGEQAGQRVGVIPGRGQGRRRGPGSGVQASLLVWL